MPSQSQFSPQAGISPKLSVRGIRKDYGATTVLHALDLNVHSGELLTLLGPSGSGKTTLLQIICGLVEPTSGRLFIDGRDETSLPVNQRDIGVVFQNYALFPHLTVKENIAFPLQMRRLPATEIDKRVAEVLDMVNLGHTADRLPKALSGGQQQRVALARCLVYRPSVILMDEPLGALDRKLRETMQIEIKRIHRETGATIIFVTHDQEEALALSDRICLMNDGVIAQVGTPQEIYEAPANRFSAEFIGLSNIFDGDIADGMLRSADGNIPGIAGMQAGDGLMVRPEHIALTDPAQGFLSGTVTETVYAGADTRLLVALESGKSIIVRQAAGFPIAPIGSSVGLTWQSSAIRIVR
ncbi:ABC transporter ATP-binding protein [Neorhizobium galegae]|uniref:ABC transporter ATP-binding protein n=1 Tax=Neorhizobium galegae TaxID=399 RepID=UPI0012756A0F|nr:ABC transporter ATP-binding protein [Neorhizobium galegae]KAA9383594.1 ABC transporter ATP-binding protein [Neorhizobium galegae]KAB1111725.1 ABC transporter ATP-binding protein [Neorhizobium galegae]MCM2500797.1 ABC transporter ATP-binding protein [Neorhizobium galegae]MCQ1769811.1 ABC transporter ATP-binding protein [Neorhizobium galegae]